MPGCFFSHACEPTRPCSSAAKRITTIERFGLAPAILIRRSASMPGAKPDPSSTPPVAPLKQSKCPPMTMYSSGELRAADRGDHVVVLDRAHLEPVADVELELDRLALLDQGLDLVVLGVEQLDVRQDRQLVPRCGVAVEDADWRQAQAGHGAEGSSGRLGPLDGPERARLHQRARQRRDELRSRRTRASRAGRRERTRCCRRRSAPTCP